MLSFTHRSQQRHVYSSPIVFPSIFAAIAVGVLTWDHFSRLHEVSIWLSVATLVAVIVRMGISFRENTGLMAALHDDAVTDSLTELGNRRKLIDDLEVGARVGAGRRRTATSSPSTTSTASSSTTTATATRRATACSAGWERAWPRPSSPVAAPTASGGDEFCILAQSRGRRIGPIVEAGRAALTEQGEGFRVSASAGAVLLPAEATAASEALRLADRRMYAEKSVRSGRLERQTHELLLSILREREPELTDHHEDVSRLAVAVGRELGLDAEEIDVLRRAAELHDIGKIAIPEEILRKPGPLDEIEWELMRKHTLVGERILGTSPSLAPVARLVRSSHERWDGERLSGRPGGRGDPARGPDHPRSATPSTRCAASVPTRPRAIGKAPSPRSAAGPAPSSTRTWSSSSAASSSAASTTIGDRATAGPQPATATDHGAYPR